tara:strand:- start:18971 stop:20740 length:1770 start_codon:yes stop_codon:yes gene_type:complete
LARGLAKDMSEKLLSEEKTIEQVSKGNKANAGFTWLLNFVLPHKKSVLGLFALSLIASSLVLMQPFLTKQVIDEGLIAKQFDTLVTFSLMLLSLGVFSTLLSGVSRYFHTKISGNILFDLREKVYCHLQTLSPSFYGDHRIGDILSRLDGDIAEIQRFALDGLFSLVSAIIGLFGAIAFLFYLNPKLALVAFILLPLEWSWLKFMRPKVEAKTKKMRERAADISSFLIETLPAMKFIQTVSAEAREAKRLTGLNARYLHTLLGLQITEFSTNSVPTLLTTLSRTLVFIIGGYWVIQDQMALGSLIAFSAYLGMAVGPVHTLLGLYVAVRRVRVSLDRVQDLTLYQADVQPQDNKQYVIDPALTLSGEIELEQVSFSYPNCSQQVIATSSLVIHSGAKVGIYGPSGVGKSTLVDLLLRHYEPSGGVVKVDGIDLKQLNLACWRKQVAVVAQDIVLFRGTLKDNIRYANPNTSDEELVLAVEQSQLSYFVAQLPQGLETVIGERGARLSGGQKQRIALARALLQKPSLLILDEATSAIDSGQEQKLMAIIDQLFFDKTRLVISHREQPINNADYLLTINNGHIVFNQVLES